MATGDPSPTTCSVCGKKTVYPKWDKDNRRQWVKIQWCVYCQRRET
jgi:hypothetical protein